MNHTCRAIFLDFDGTYADHGVVPAGHVNAVRTVRAAGHRVFLCTGRPRSTIRGSVLAELDGFVASAGGYVDVGGKVLADHRFPAHLAAVTVSILDQHDVAYLLEAPEAIYGPPGVDRRVAALLVKHLPRSNSSEREGPLDILAALRMSADLTAASFAKITCFDSPVPMASLVEQIGPEVGALPSSVPDMGDSAGEIHLTSVHKAVGMKLVTEHLGLDQAQVIAIGDGLNDVEMLEYAGVGVAIEGSDRRVLAAADHVAPGPDLEGLKSAFAELGLLAAPHAGDL